MSTAPDGLFEYGGAPVSGGRFSSPWATHYFVDYDNGADSNDGRSPDGAMKTIQAAVTATGRGDVIYIRPRKYTSDGSDVERYIEAVTVPYATADLSMIGVSNTYQGNPNYGAKLQYTETSGTALTVNAPAFHIENMCVRAEGADYAIDFVSNSDYSTAAGSCGPTMYNVVIRGSLYGVRLSGGYAANIVGSRFEGGAATDSSIVLYCSAQVQRRVRIKDCHFDCFNGAANDNAYIRIYGPTTDLLIYRCTFDIVGGDGTYINATGTNLGLVADCFFGASDLSTTAIVEGGLKIVGAWDTGGINTST